MDGTALILTNNFHDQGAAKTAHGLVRGTERYRILALLDPHNPGKDAGKLLDGKPRNIPIFADLASLLAAGLGKIDYCVIGVATKGGVFPRDLQPTVEAALRAGMSVVSGLHECLADIPELVDLAAQHGAQLIDVRRPRSRHELHFWSGEIRQVTCPRVAVLGTDCNLGKRTTARLLTQAATRAGLQAQMIYTGQTGWLQGGQYGFVFDSTPNDFISGEIENALVQCFRETAPDVMFIEGQSALRNPSGPCGSEFLVSGECEAVVLQHAPARTYYNGFEHLNAKIPSLQSEVLLLRMYGTQTIGITLNTVGLDRRAALRYKIQYEDELGIPVVLPLEEGVDSLLPCVQQLIDKRKPVDTTGPTS